MKKYFISSAYIYPLCPLNINHAKMFIIGDIMARYYREKGYDVYFPIASHYSGNTAQKFSKAIETIFNNKNKEKSNNKEEQRIFDLYNKVYLIPRTILKSFKEPMNLLNYFNSEILWELKALNISGNYEAFYTTKNEDFSVFVNTIISKYKENNLWIKNIKEELAVDYNNKKWKQRTIEVINRTEFIQPVMKNSILSATEHIRNDWGTLRDNGFGVKYQNRWIIDPMFDSELFTIFDVYMKFSRKEKEEHDLKELFHNLFNVLQKKEKPKSTIVKKIVEYLPCDMFICEEHLKNWILKKFYAESLLLKKNIKQKNTLFWEWDC